MMRARVCDRRRVWPTGLHHHWVQRPGQTLTHHPTLLPLRTGWRWLTAVLVLVLVLVLVVLVLLLMVQCPVRVQRQQRWRWRRQGQGQGQTMTTPLGLARRKRPSLRGQRGRTRSLRTGGCPQRRWPQLRGPQMR
jgi:hypothetical protein